MADSDRLPPLQTDHPRDHATSANRAIDPRSAQASSARPKMDREVSALSDKLIDAINHSTMLDDALSQTRHELEASKARIAQLEAEAKAHEDRLTRGELIPRAEVDERHNKVTAQLAEEKRQRTMVQQEKRGIEMELESLTASLFDEANKMVAAANRDREAAERKNQQLRDQIKDGEAVIASQIEQLAELKMLMQQFSPSPDHRRDPDSPRVSIAPSSPGAPRDEHNLTRLLEAMHLSPAALDHGELVPSPSTSLTHLVKPQCRTDIPAYEDFKMLVQTASFRSHNPSHAPSRAGSGSYGGLNVIGLGALNNSASNLSQTSQSATSKLANSPTIPGSFSPNPEGKGPVPLKDTRFYKRILSEDIEPTLRLDLSPTLSWLNRRSILSALGESTLIVEPIPEASLKLYGKYTPCALCGENRKEGENPRTHAMRVREGEGATKWMICVLCLEKVRGVGDLVAYVRLVREGVVKVGDKKDEEEAWEELVRLRERLFWARMAGGVIPSFLPTPKQTPIDNPGEDHAAEREDDGDGAAHGDGPVPAAVTAPEPAVPQETNLAASVDPASTIEPSSNGSAASAQEDVDKGLTTFDSVQEKRASHNSAVHRVNSTTTTPPSTPPRNHTRDSSGGANGLSFPRINIPRLPAGFWEGQVNTLR